MNKAREGLQNMRQLEHESVSVYMCDIQGILGILVTFRMCVPSDVPRQLALMFAYVVMT